MRVERRADLIEQRGQALVGVRVRLRRPRSRQEVDLLEQRRDLLVVLLHETDVQGAGRGAFDQRVPQQDVLAVMVVMQGSDHLGQIVATRTAWAVSPGFTARTIGGASPNSRRNTVWIIFMSSVAQPRCCPSLPRLESTPMHIGVAIHQPAWERFRLVRSCL